MDNYIPVYLSDQNLLTSIYRLRVDAWSEYKNINHILFQDGWFDSLDSLAHHWYIEDNHNIIASARLNIICSLSEIPYGKIFLKFEETLSFPLIFYSKLVVHPAYRNRGLSNKLDECRDAFSRDSGHKYSLITTDKSWRAKKLITRGWTIIGFVDPIRDDKWLLGKSKILYRISR